VTEPVLGIDISKLKFNLCLINSTGKLRHKLFPNTAAGFVQLKEWLEKQGVGSFHACLKATGTYSEPLALFLHEAGQKVSVVNPATVKAFAQSRLARTKTDKADAEPVTRFRLVQRPPAWSPPASEVRELQALYSPAVTALRCNAFFRAWAEGLQARGKCKMTVSLRGHAQAHASRLRSVEVGPAVQS
jgi:transposase